MKRAIFSIIFLAMAVAAAPAGPNRAGAGQAQRGGYEQTTGAHTSAGPAARAGALEQARDRTPSHERIHTPGSGDPAVKSRNRECCRPSIAL